MKNKFKITIQRIHDNEVIDKSFFEILEDSDLWVWKSIFQAILCFVTFDIEQVKELFEGEKE